MQLIFFSNNIIIHKSCEFLTRVWKFIDHKGIMMLDQINRIIQILYSIAIIIKITDFLAATNGMINNNNYNHSERSPKTITPNSPQPRKKNIDFSNNTPIQPTIGAIDYARKQVNSFGLNSKQPYYPQNGQNANLIECSTERQSNLQKIIRQLSDKMAKISQKIIQHESILLKMTQNSIENNKQEYKKNNNLNKQQLIKSNQSIHQILFKLKKDFEDYKCGNIATREIEVKNQLFSQLIHKSQERMREEMQSIVKKYSQITSKISNNSTLSDQRWQELDRSMKKIEKNVSLNATKIFGAHQKIQTISSSIDGHMDLINAEVNKTISKIVAFVNEKVSKPINESIATLTEKMNSLELDSKSVYFGGLKSSFIRSQKEVEKVQYRQILTVYQQQIIISEYNYHIDIDGYLLDKDFYYLIDKNDDKIRLDENQIKLLRKEDIIA